MHDRTTWQNPQDGVTHAATVLHDDPDSSEIRTDCGLLRYVSSSERADAPLEITCSPCQRTSSVNGQPLPGSEGEPEILPRRQPRGQSRPAEPKVLGDILDEMRLPTTKHAPAEPNCRVFRDGDVIHRYTRADALRDGLLIDVTAPAKEVGIRYPTALTTTVWSEYVRIPEGVVVQDETGRLWDILCLLRHAIQRSTRHSDTVHFYLHVRNDNHGTKRYLLKAVCGPDDDGAPCLTVMLPEED